MKNNKQRTDDWHSKRGTIIYYTRLIEDLISEGNVEKAQKLILELIDEYPDDYTLLMLQARIYIFEGKYDDAKKIIEKFDEEKHFLKLTLIAIKQNNLEMMKYYYEKYYKFYEGYVPKELVEIFRYLELYLKMVFDPKLIDLSKDDRYMCKQLVNFSKDATLKHIKSNHSDITVDSQKTIFNEELDISELFDEITSLIENNRDKCKVNKYLDTYVIYYPACGRTYDSSNNSLNYIIVGVITNTINIATMYPAKLPNKSNVIYRDHTFSRGKVKQLSAIEKFNQKYGSM